MKRELHRPSGPHEAIKAQNPKYSFYHFNEIIDIKLKLIHFLEKKAHSQNMEGEQDDRRSLATKEEPR
jgi:hypothetical protein